MESEHESWLRKYVKILLSLTQKLIISFVILLIILFSKHVFQDLKFINCQFSTKI